MTLPELRLAKSQLVDQQRKIQMYKALQALHSGTLCVYVNEFTFSVLTYHNEAGLGLVYKKGFVK